MLSELLHATSSFAPFDFCEEFMRTLRTASHTSLEEKLERKTAKKKAEANTPSLKKSNKKSASAARAKKSLSLELSDFSARFLSPRKTPKKKKDETIDEKVKIKKGSQKKQPIAIPDILHDKFIHGAYSSSYTFDPRYQELFSYQGGNLKFGQSYYNHIQGKTENTHTYNSDPLISNTQIEKILKRKQMEEITKIGRLYTNNEMPWMGTADDQAFSFYKMSSWNFIWNRVKYTMMVQGMS